jgi:hypothetical protein
MTALASFSAAALFVALGVAVGVAHAALLARAARSGPSPLGALVRLLLVASVLVLAATLDHVAAAAIGWGIGFVVAAAVIRRRLR